MSNNSVIEGVKGMVVVSRCKRKSIPVIDAPLNEGGYSDWRLLIPHGYITLSEAVKRFGYGLSLKALMKIMYAAKVPTHTLHILKNEGVVTPETDVVEVFPTYRLLCLPQTAKYQYLERKDGYGSGVLIPDGGADDDDDADQNRGESTITTATDDATTDTYYIFDGIDPITVTLVNAFSARMAMQNFLHDVMERPFHPYDFTHPLFKDNGHGGLLYGFDVRKAWKQHKIDVVRCQQQPR
ncbi:hypothetical protein [uncultured Bilophila sp.]|uniref:hypothetical protein n=1 Tax=uncultured Bilophila sp. TaxID=529385 RepID=UPI0025CBBC93|nr:hypothetical protein [uncultured Bilophila sp.]